MVSTIFFSWQIKLRGFLTWISVKYWKDACVLSLKESGSPAFPPHHTPAAKTLTRNCPTFSYQAHQRFNHLVSSFRNKYNKKAQLTQRERATAVHV